MADAAIPYEEPGIVTILVQASFFLALSIVNSILDNVFFCGLVGQVLIGMAWGTPGAKILSHQFEEMAMQLGYLGLILIVFEGGLSTSAKSVQTTLLLSTCVAITGIALPIAFSFSLLALADATNLQAFAAGAALCSTSLGTTFSILKTTGLANSRLGTVLTSAAMLDDVVGLIMVQVISNLGDGSESIEATTVIRPIFVSIALALILPLACRFLVKPVLNKYFNGHTKTWIGNRANKLVSNSSAYFLLSTPLLLGLVCAASYAGTSGLFAAYLAGACIAWLDDSIAQTNATTPADINGDKPPRVCASPRGTAKVDSPHSSKSNKGKNSQGVTDSTSARHQHDDQITSAGSTRLPTPPPEDNADDTERTLHAIPSTTSDVENRGLNMYDTYYGPAVERILKPFFFASIGFSIPISKMFRGSVVWRGFVYSVLMAIGKLFCGAWLVRLTKASTTTPATSSEQKKKPSHQSVLRPKSLYPASLLGCAMVARGEIGFLISALAASNGIFGAKDATSEPGSSNLESDLYLIVTWAILLCTVVGPLALGFLARRVKRLQAERAKSGTAGGEDPLGIWGVG